METEKHTGTEAKFRYDYFEGKNLIAFFLLFGLFIVSLQYKTLQHFSLSLTGVILNNTFMGVWFSQDWWCEHATTNERPWKNRKRRLGTGFDQGRYWWRRKSNCYFQTGKARDDISINFTFYFYYLLYNLCFIPKSFRFFNFFIQCL